MNPKFDEKLHLPYIASSDYIGLTNVKDDKEEEEEEEEEEDEKKRRSRCKEIQGEGGKEEE